MSQSISHKKSRLNSDFVGFIRSMTEYDLLPVLAIENAAYDYPWTPGIMSDCLKVGYHCFVYEVDCEIRGYIIFSTVLDEVHLLNLCIAPHYQHKGYGRAFLNWLMNHLRDLGDKKGDKKGDNKSGSKTLYLEVRASNHAAINLYESMGFNELGIRPDYYPAKNGKEDAQLFACELSHT